MSGYWNLPEKTERAFRDGWFITGDVARYDDDGYIVHAGRKSVDILKVGGYKISAREIEEQLAKHSDIEEVAVLGVTDAEWGERVGAAIVPTEAAPERTKRAWLDELERFLRGDVADYKRPQQIALCDALPRNALGKIQKHRLLHHFSK